MKLKPFKELIAMSKEKLDEAMAPIRAKQVQSQAQVKMAELEGEILTMETEIQEMCIGKTIDFDKMLDRMDDLAMKELRREKYDDLLEQLFPEKKKA